MPIFTVCLRAFLTLGYQWYTRKRNIKDNTDLFKFYLDDVQDDINDLLELINLQKSEVNENIEAGAITNGDFIFNILDKIEFSSILSHLRRKEKDDYLERINDIYSSFTLAKHEVERLAVVNNDYQVNYLAYEERFYFCRAIMKMR